MTIVVRTLILAVITLFITVPANAQSLLVLVGNNMPHGYKKFCRNDLRNCQPMEGRAGWEKNQTKILEKVNTEINSVIRFKNDPEGEDIWELSYGPGDCENYVLLKRHILMKKYGWPSSRLLITTLHSGESAHAVLVAVLSTGVKVVLDDLRTQIFTLGVSLAVNRYKIHSQQVPEDPNWWTIFDVH